MTPPAVKGSCLCGSVAFELTGPPSAFRYCHCSRCRKATGSAHAANLFVPQDRFRWLSGESQVGRYKVPQAKFYTVFFCARCGSRVPHLVAERGEFLVPAGLLDGDPQARPQHSIYWDSRAPWLVETASLPKFPERPA
jgi:hypothetical protein